MLVVTVGLLLLALVWIVIVLPVDLVRSAAQRRRPTARRGRSVPTFRIGDRERARACSALGEAYAVGRVTLPELERRVQQTLIASTVADLRCAVADLPEARLRVTWRR